MNKRCTNSSCRRTFSTLHFNGQCPFCGKEYPQLRTDEAGFEQWIYTEQLQYADPVILADFVRRERFRTARAKAKGMYKVSFSGWSFIIPACFLPFIKESIFLLETGNKVMAIKALRAGLRQKGLEIRLKNTKHFVDDIQARVQPCIKWKVLETEPGRKELIPCTSR